MNTFEKRAENRRVLDQVVRALTGNKYEEWVKKQKTGEDGPETYDWEEGIPP